MLRGLVSGLFAGILYGVFIMLRGKMPVYGSMIGMPETVYGWAVVLAYVALLGAIFGVVCNCVQTLPTLLTIGVLYGLGAGILMAFVIMPLTLDMSLHMSYGAILSSLPMVLGYAAFGTLMALCYHVTKGSE